MTVFCMAGVITKLVPYCKPRSLETTPQLSTWAGNCEFVNISQHASSTKPSFSWPDHKKLKGNKFSIIIPVIIPALITWYKNYNTRMLVIRLILILSCLYEYTSCAETVWMWFTSKCMGLCVMYLYRDKCLHSHNLWGYIVTHPRNNFNYKPSLKLLYE